MKIKFLQAFLVIFFFASPCRSISQTLASNRTRAEGRYNGEKLFADRQRKIFNITSWAGHSISDLLSKWGNFTRKNELMDGITVYVFENTYSGSGGRVEEGYVVTDQFGNILDFRNAKDNRYSYHFTDYYEFYVNRDNKIIFVKLGTR